MPEDEDEVSALVYVPISFTPQPKESHLCPNLSQPYQLGRETLYASYVPYFVPTVTPFTSGQLFPIFNGLKTGNNSCIVH